MPTLKKQKYDMNKALRIALHTHLLRHANPFPTIPYIDAMLFPNPMQPGMEERISLNRQAEVYEMLWAIDARDHIHCLPTDVHGN